MVLLHCPDGCLPLTVIHVMVLVWGKDPQKLREVCASRVIVQTPGQKGKCDYFPMKRLHYSSERTRIRAKKVLSLLQRWGTGGEERTTIVVPVHKRVLTMYEFQPGEIRQDTWRSRPHYEPEGLWWIPSQLSSWSMAPLLSKRSLRSAGYKS